MSRPNILFICGSLNQTTICHAIARHLEDEFDCFFTPYYGDGLIRWATDQGWLDWTVMGGRFREQTEDYFARQKLRVDYGGRFNDYALVITTSDLLVQRNIRGKPLVLVQEGMTDPENLVYRLVRRFHLPRWLASTATTGLSDAYACFCVASEGYRQHFIRKGVRPEKIIVTGIPNFDHAAALRDNSFPFHGYVLVATSDTRETFKRDNRRRFINEALTLAGDRQVVFKLHPNEDHVRNRAEILAQAPGAVVMADGDIGPMIANCEALITQYSSVALIGLALGKEVHSYFEVEELRRLAPIQNGGASGRRIAQVCRSILLEPARAPVEGWVYASV